MPVLRIGGQSQVARLAGTVDQALENSRRRTTSKAAGTGTPWLGMAVLRTQRAVMNGR